MVTTGIETTTKKTHNETEAVRQAETTGRVETTTKSQSTTQAQVTTNAGITSKITVEIFALSVAAFLCH